MKLTELEYQNLLARTAMRAAKARQESFKAKLSISPTSDESKLNKTEAGWLTKLRDRFRTEQIGIQSITLKLADDCRYTPDFWTVGDGGELTFWEVKGFWRDDAKVKIKVAARLFRWARFFVVQKKAGQFIESDVMP